MRSDVLLALWDALDKQGAKLAKPGPARVIYELAREEPATKGTDTPNFLR